MSTQTMSPMDAGERPDQAVLADVTDRIWQDATTRAIERSALAVEVDRQEVSLLGHVTNLDYRRRVVELARQAPGVRAVHNHLVADPELVSEVAQALAADPRTRLSVLGVGAFYGWLHLSGTVPDLAARLAADEVTARVGHVRGVLSLPHLPDEHNGRAENRRPLQPRVAQPVYALDGPVGLVEHVIVDPHNRLVSHIVVGGTLDMNWRPVRGQWVLPMAAVARANDSGVFLAERVSAVAARPAYHPADLRPPPAGWLAPFPYRAGEVHWLVATEPEPPTIPITDLLLPAARLAARDSLSIATGAIIV